MPVPDASLSRRYVTSFYCKEAVTKTETDRDGTNSYTNPVYDRSFPDPFVLKFGGAFYGFATGFSADGRLVFPVIRSLDLVNWETQGAAMEPIISAPPLYWAPEVTYSDGHFYLYYSCGNEENMELRVAVSDRPDGGFADSGVRLTNEQFAIDAHVFIDDDGERYLFYATDFLDHTHIGTGTVVDRMVDWFHLEGNPRPVTRAKYDWQVYDPLRAEKGNVRWHTVEGPCVVKRKGKYFQMFSGGNWKNDSYGVAYAVSDNVLNDHEWKQSIDGSIVFPILRSSEKTLGPGHNSLVLGPNNREMYCVYHSWVNDERMMSVDRMDIIDDRLILSPPTVSDRQLPFFPRSASAQETGLRFFEIVSPDFLLDTTVRLASNDDHFVFAVYADNGGGLGELGFTEGRGYFQAGDSGGSSQLLPGLALGAYQCLRLEVNAGTLRIRLNGLLWYETQIPIASGHVRIEIEHSVGAEVLNLDLTEGFIDLFESNTSLNGWLGSFSGTVLAVDNETLKIEGPGPLIVTRGSCFISFEYAVNLRAISESPFGFALIGAQSEIEMLIEISDSETGGLSVGEKVRRNLIRPPPGGPLKFRQYRFVKKCGDISVEIDGHILARYKVSSRPSRIGIVTNGHLIVDMARMIRIDC